MTDKLTKKPASEIQLSGGYVMETDAEDRPRDLSIRAPDGRVCLKVILTPDGPVVELDSVSLSIAARGDLKMSCDNLQIDADNSLALNAGGDLSLSAGGELRTEGFSQMIRARRGEVRVKANDDVTLDGERIRLNSPKVLK